MDPGCAAARLPQPSQLLTTIINQLSTIEPEPKTNYSLASSTHNPLSSLHPDILPKAKSLLLTLHCLFPNELLLALDILDKRLVTKCSIFSPGREQPEQDAGQQGQRKSQDIYFVRSQSTLSSTSSSAADNPEGSINSPYEVHLHAWNCTCPAFTLAMVRELSCDGSSDEDDDERGNQTMEQGITDQNTTDGWVFGGSLTKRHTMRGAQRESEQISGSFAQESVSAASPRPICCKHLLACVLAARCPRLFASGVREVGVDLSFPTSTENAEPSDDATKEKYKAAAWHAGYGG